MSVTVLERSAVSRPSPRRVASGDNQANLVYQTRCATCGGRAYALGGGTLWCFRCLQPFAAAGERYVPSYETRNVPA